MIIKGYGLELVRLRHDDTEMVRNWRNAAHISRYMEFREYITPEMQEEWFRSIDNVNNNYFIISVDRVKIGLINGSQIDWEAMETGNGGIFIWDSQYSKTLAPLRASFLLTDLSFFLGMKRTFIRVLRDNPAAISYNVSLGYTLLPDQEEVYNQQYVLTKESYSEKTRRLKQTLSKAYPPEITVIIDDPENASSQMLLTKYHLLSATEQKNLTFILPAAHG